MSSLHLDTRLQCCPWQYRGCSNRRLYNGQFQRRASHQLHSTEVRDLRPGARSERPASPELPSSVRVSPHLIDNPPSGQWLESAPQQQQSTMGKSYIRRCSETQDTGSSGTPQVIIRESRVSRSSDAEQCTRCHDARKRCERPENHDLPCDRCTAQNQPCIPRTRRNAARFSKKHDMVQVNGSFTQGRCVY